MLYQIVRQADVVGVTSDSKANGSIPLFGIHHGLIFFAKTAAGVPCTAAEIIAEIEDIVIRINGKIKVDADATFLLSLYKYWFDKNESGAGAFTVAGGIPILFTRPHLQSAGERSLLAWGMKDVNSFSYEISFGTLTDVASVEVYSLIEDGAMNLGRHVCLTRHPMIFSSTGVQQNIDMPFKESDVFILADHLGEGSGTIDDVKVRVNKDDIWANVPAALNTLILHQAGRTVQAGYYPVDYTLMNDRSSGLPSGPVNSLRYDINFSVQPDNYVVYREAVHGMDSPLSVKV